MKKGIIYSAIAIFTIIAATSLPQLAVPAAAQSDTSYICMQRSIAGASTGNNIFTIIVKSGQKSNFESKGFSLADCNGRLSKLAEYRQQICNMAQTAPPPVQAGFTNSYGASPSQLCQAVS